MQDLLAGEIKSEFGKLTNVELGSSEHTAAVTSLTKLMEKNIELKKFDVEREDKLELQRRQEELEQVKLELDKQERQNRLDLQAKQLELQQKQIDLQKEQHKQNVKNNTIQILVAVGTTLLTAALTVWGTNTTLEFEKEGTVTTTAGRGFMGRLFNKK